jgi:hypothetical protein
MKNETTGTCSISKEELQEILLAHINRKHSGRFSINKMVAVIKRDESTGDLVSLDNLLVLAVAIERSA